jgi:hypothetical protein
MTYKDFVRKWGKQRATRQRYKQHSNLGGSGGGGGGRTSPLTSAATLRKDATYNWANDNPVQHISGLQADIPGYGTQGGGTSFDDYLANVYQPRKMDEALNYYNAAMSADATGNIHDMAIPRGDAAAARFQYLHRPDAQRARNPFVAGRFSWWE